MPYTHEQLGLIARYEQLRQLDKDRVARQGVTALFGDEAERLEEELCRLEEELPEGYWYVGDPE